MSLADTALNIAFSEGKKQSKATIYKDSESVDVVVGYLTSRTSEMEDAGFDNGYGDLTVLAKTSEISDWNLLRDVQIGFIGQHYSGSLVVRDQLRYIGPYTWINLDRKR